MQNQYKPLEVNGIYAQGQAVFAKMQSDAQIRKRKHRRRKALMWVLRKL